MTVQEILQLRLANQQLINPVFTSPAEVVTWLGAVQAQDYTGAKWAIGQRMKNATDEILENAFTKGDIIRTHVLRPTWHFVHPDDITWMLQLTAPRINGIMRYYNRMLALDEAVFKKTQSVIEKALTGKKALTREDLIKILKAKGIDGTGQRFAHIMMTAELQGLICSGPRKGKQFTYMLLEERVPKTKVLDKDASLAKLVKQYFQSHGPATIQDFAWWSGLSIIDVKRGLEVVHPHLEKEVVEGITYYFYHTPSISIKNTLSLIPNYDEYTVAYKNRSIIFNNAHSSRLDSRSNPLFQNSIIWNGEIIGTWKRSLQKKALYIEPTFFETSTHEIHNAFIHATEKFSQFLSIPLV